MKLSSPLMLVLTAPGRIPVERDRLGDVQHHLRRIDREDADRDGLEDLHGLAGFGFARCRCRGQRRPSPRRRSDGGIDLDALRLRIGLVKYFGAVDT